MTLQCHGRYIINPTRHFKHGSVLQVPSKAPPSLQTGGLQYLKISWSHRGMKPLLGTHRAGQPLWPGRVPAARSAGGPSPAPRLRCTAPGGGHPDGDDGRIRLPPMGKRQNHPVTPSCGDQVVCQGPRGAVWCLLFLLLYCHPQGVLLDGIWRVCFVWDLPLCMRCIKVQENNLWFLWDRAA